MYRFAFARKESWVGICWKEKIQSGEVERDEI